MFIKNEKINVGDVTKTTIEHESCAGKFTIGSEVTVVGISPRGYEIIDSDGNRMVEIGWKI